MRKEPSRVGAWCLLFCIIISSTPPSHQTLDASYGVLGTEFADNLITSRFASCLPPFRAVNSRSDGLHAPQPTLKPVFHYSGPRQISSSCLVLQNLRRSSRLLADDFVRSWWLPTRGTSFANEMVTISRANGTKAGSNASLLKLWITECSVQLAISPHQSGPNDRAPDRAQLLRVPCSVFVPSTE